MVEQHVNAAKGAFIVACATTLIMVIQIILMLVGAGSNGFEAADGDLVGGADFDGDADFDGGSDIAQSDLGAFGMKLLGIRSIMAFLCIFRGWATPAFISWIGGGLCSSGWAPASRRRCLLRCS